MSIFKEATWYSSFVFLAVFVCASQSGNFILDADIVEIDPFTGTFSEDFDNFPNISDGVANSELNAFGGFARLSVTTGVLKLERSSTRNGDTVLPRSQPRMLLSFETVDWAFDAPITEFGAYFENNSDTDNGTTDFFDVNDNLLGTRTIDTLINAQTWTWNGWRSDIPIGRIQTRGNSSLFEQGFFFYEDSQVTLAPMPEPGCLVLLCSIGLCWFPRRRKKSR